MTVPPSRCFIGTLEFLKFVAALQAMSIIDSEAAFERKCKELRNGDELFNGLDRLGIKDFSTLAFTLEHRRRRQRTNSLKNLVTRSMVHLPSAN